MMFLKMLMVLLFVLDTSVHKAVLVFTATAFGVIGFYMHAVYQPYYKPVVNRTHSAFYVAYLWTCLCLALLEIRGKPTVRVCIDTFFYHPEPRLLVTGVCVRHTVVQANVESFLFVLGVPSAAFVGYGLAKLIEARAEFPDNDAFFVRRSGGPVAGSSFQMLCVRPLSPRRRNSRRGG